MVYKSNILGKPPLIVVTVGTTSFPFYRVFKTIDGALYKMKMKYTIVVQSRAQSYKWQYPNVTSIDELSPSKSKALLKKADKIITHGGFGSLYDIYTTKAVMPLIVARLKKYREHVDDHQKYFIDLYKAKTPQGYSKYLVSSSLTEGMVKHYLEAPRKENILQEIFDFSDKQKSSIIPNLHKYINDT